MNVSVDSSRHHICSSIDAVVRLPYPHLMKHTWHGLSIDHLGPCYLLFRKALGEGLDFPIFNANAIVAFVLLVFYGQSEERTTYLISLAVTTFPLRTTRSNLLVILLNEGCFWNIERVLGFLVLLMLNAPQIRYRHNYLHDYQFTPGFPSRSPDRPIVHQGPSSDVLSPRKRLITTCGRGN